MDTDAVLCLSVVFYVFITFYACDVYAFSTLSELCDQALDLAVPMLCAGVRNWSTRGVFVCKLFAGEGEQEFLGRVKQKFTTVRDKHDECPYWSHSIGITMNVPI